MEVEHTSWVSFHGEEAGAGFGSALVAVGDYAGGEGLDLLGGLPRVDRETSGFDVGGVAIWLDISQ